MSFRLLRVAMLAAFACTAFAQCEAAGSIKEAVNAYNAVRRTSGTPAEQRAARTAILQKAFAETPTDYFLLDRLRDLLDDNTSDGRAASLARFTELRAKYPDSVEVTTVYAEVLRAKDSAQSQQLIEAAAKAHPDFPWIHQSLFRSFESGNARNPERLGEEIEAFLKLCEPTAGAYIYRVMLGAGPVGVVARHAPRLRARLEAWTGVPDQQLWPVLWDMEFKTAPPATHPAVRERIGKDLARLSEGTHPDTAAWLAFLRAGYTRIDDKLAADRVADRIVSDFPNAGEAERIVTERWNKEHPFPKDGDAATIQAFHRASAAAAHEWRQRWPRSLLWLNQEFFSTAALDDTRPDALLKLAEEFVQAYHTDSNSFYGGLPMEFEVAQALIKKKALPTAIPAWMEEGHKRELARPSRGLGEFRDDLPPAFKANADRQIDNMRIARARILLDYYEAAGQPNKAAGIDDSLVGFTPIDDRMKPELFEVRAKAAEMDNRKLDAIILYRAAREMGGRPSVRPVPGEKTDVQMLDEKIAALWKTLGGTPASYGIFSGKAKIEPVEAVRWERPRNQLPNTDLTDLQGKTWALSNFNGKATLINVWATWCGPCRAEHPDFQKLYEKMKDRSDIAVLSLNVDQEVGLVAGYMSEFHYTFPVVLGKEVLSAVVGGGEIAIPQNWFLGPNAKIEWTQMGYLPDPNWQSMMAGKLDELLKKK
jgi:thiol-disulfide isomerase/thioredoxin